MYYICAPDCAVYCTGLNQWEDQVKCIGALPDQWLTSKVCVKSMGWVSWLSDGLPAWLTDSLTTRHTTQQLIECSRVPPLLYLTSPVISTGITSLPFNHFWKGVFLPGLTVQRHTSHDMNKTSSTVSSKWFHSFLTSSCLIHFQNQCKQFEQPQHSLYYWEDSLQVVVFFRYALFSGSLEYLIPMPHIKHQLCQLYASFVSLINYESICWFHQYVINVAIYKQLFSLPLFYFCCTIRSRLSVAPLCITVHLEP